MLAVRNIILNAVLIICQLITFLKLYQPRIKSRNARMMYAGFVSALILVYAASVCMIGVEMAARLVFFICAVPAILFYMVTSGQVDGKFWVSYCVSGMAVGAANTIGLIIVAKIWGEQDFANILVRCTMMIAVSALVCFLASKPYRKALLMMEEGWRLFGVLLAVFYLFFMVYVSFPSPILDRPEDFGTAFMMITVIILAFVGILSAVIRMGRMSEVRLNQEEQRNELEIADIRIQSGEAQYRTMMENVEKIKLMRHDLAHHFRMILSFCESENYKELETYLKDMDIQGITEKPFYYSKNHVVNVMLGYYAEQAKEKGIRFDCGADIPEGVPENASHLGVILGNGLENAICAAQEVKENPHILVKIRYFNRKTVIVIKNNYCGRILETEQGIQSTKEGKGHGAGIRSMKRIAEMYEGYCEYRIGSSEFTLNIVLHIEQNMSNKESV